MLKQIFKTTKPLIGMIHLPPMPGYPSHPGMPAVVKKALKDLSTLEAAGFDGALVENDNDQPHQTSVMPEVEQAFRLVMQELLKCANIPVGMEIIYDMPKTLIIALDVGADFIRFDVFNDSVKTQWGVVPAQARELMSVYDKFAGKKPFILADVHVKHASLVSKKTLLTSALESIDKGAHGLIVTGDWTGKPPLITDCKVLYTHTANVIIGSGVTVQNITHLLNYADGVIVGTSIKTGDYIDIDKAKKLASVVRKLRNK